MKIKNKIINYFVLPLKDEGKMPIVYMSPVTINASIAKELIIEQAKKEKDTISSSLPLHVCYDYDSERLYIPNANDFQPDKLEGLLQAAQIRIIKDFGRYSFKKPIFGSPFSSLRIRSIDSFSHAKEIIGKKGNNIPVIEAQLDRMPSTKKRLPECYKNKDFLGGYIGKNSNIIPFVEEIDISGKKHKEPRLLLSQQPPFILINTSQDSERKDPSATEKEWVVLSGYRDYLNDNNAIEDEISKSSDLYGIKRYLYLGWTFEEVCITMLNGVDSIPKMFNAIDRLMRAANSLEKEGYTNPSSIPYYITFKIDESFPINMASVTDLSSGKIKTNIQYENFVILDHNRNNDYVVIKTPVFISPELFIKIFHARSNPFIVRYNGVTNTIDIKSDLKSYKSIQNNAYQLDMIKTDIKSKLSKDQTKSLTYRGGELASGVSASNPNIYSIKYVSDYLYATDHIKKMCKECNIPFKDFMVVSGPIEQTFGSGIRGGYMDSNMFTLNKMKTPTELSKGVWMSPPVILINSAEEPSPADQTEVIIHEYRHYIFGIQNPNYKIQYGKPKKGRGQDYEHWYRYFNDPNEGSAHKDQIKFALGLGKSYDEIIRDKVGGQITIDNYPIAIKFSEMVGKALKELEEEMV